MIKQSLAAVLAISILSCSDKNSEEPWELVGTVEGEVTLVTEFGTQEEIKGGATISFQAGNESKETISDAEGAYAAAEIPMGTYDVVFKKEGFATSTVRGTRIIGGSMPLYLYQTLTRPSTTTITNLTAVPSGAYFILNSIVNHGNTNPSPFVPLIVFVGTSADVSSQNYVFSRNYNFMEPSGASFNSTIYIDKQAFPSGSTAYMIAYGMAYSYNILYNPETRLNEYVGLSATPSNVVSVKIP